MADTRETERNRRLRVVLDEQERERSDVAHRLHDELAQSLAVVLFGLDTLASRADAGSAARLGTLREHVTGALSLCTELAAGLRPSVLGELGLGPALESLGDRLGAQRVRVDLGPLATRLPADLETQIYRSAEDALSAAGPGSELTVSLDSDARELRVSVRWPHGDPRIAELGRLEARLELIAGRLARGPGALRIRIPVPERNRGSIAAFPQRRPVETPDGGRRALP